MPLLQVNVTFPSKWLPFNSASSATVTLVTVAEALKQNVCDGAFPDD